MEYDITEYEISEIFHEAACRPARKTKQVGSRDWRCVAEWKQEEAEYWDFSNLAEYGCSGSCADCLEPCSTPLG